MRRALNVCGNAGQASFGGCGAGCITFPKSFDAGETLDNVATIAKLLELKIQVLMVYGMKDTTCNYEGRSLRPGIMNDLHDSPSQGHE